MSNFQRVRHHRRKEALDDASLAPEGTNNEARSMPKPNSNGPSSTPPKPGVSRASMHSTKPNKPPPTAKSGSVTWSFRAKTNNGSKRPQLPAHDVFAQQKRKVPAAKRNMPKIGSNRASQMYPSSGKKKERGDRRHSEYVGHKQEKRSKKKGRSEKMKERKKKSASVSGIAPKSVFSPPTKNRRQNRQTTVITRGRSSGGVEQGAVAAGVGAAEDENIEPSKIAKRERLRSIRISSDDKRTKIAGEILSTEETFVKSLQTMIQYYKAPLAKAGFLVEALKKMFDDIELLLNFNIQLLKEFKERIPNWGPITKIGDVFTKMAPFLKMYSKYSNNYQSAIVEYKRIVKENDKFRDTVEQSKISSKMKLELPDYFIMPIQRVPRYVMLIADLLKHTEEAHPDHENLIKALELLRQIASSINEGVRKWDNAKIIANLGKGANLEGLIAPHRYLITEGVVKTEEKKKDALHFFLFNDILVHIKQAFLKAGANLALAEYSLPLNLVWLMKVERRNEMSVMLIGPEGKKIQLNDNEWVKKIEQAQHNLFSQTPNVTNDDTTRYGRYTYPSTAIYEGYWKHGKRHGKGRYSHLGGVYDGEWKEDWREGNGKLTYPTGERYNGEWKDDLQNGQGELSLPTGGRYVGDWLDGKRHGQGQLKFNNGDVYEGDWTNDSATGEGKLKLANGTSYEGQFNENKFHGEGTITYINGQSYCGGWNNGVKHGKGEVKYANGSVYYGHFQHDLRHGNGTYTDTLTGEVFTGEWQYNMKEGHGNQKYRDGSEYQGQWLRGARSGVGCMCYANKCKYQGDWLHNKRHGQGSFVGRNGSTYKGEWEHGYRSGKGTMTYQSGARYEGFWLYDKWHKGGRLTGHQKDWIILYEGEWNMSNMHGKGYIEFRNGDSYKGGFAFNLFHGSGTYTFANGTTFNGKWTNGTRDGKCSFNIPNRGSFQGSIKHYTNTIYQSNVPDGLGLSVPPPFPVFFPNSSTTRETVLQTMD
eukprot:CAMPEP_0168522080 /NCGR_PEP_ID=MMETSP0405-20121227/9081_1 /TAXON_ID=498012 /ORGANISM="Trichosphaerium sp, Strain Am-I-7 wt" /LENGTH=984 /DNA_ID=CAMNT_0008543507 /DNA_START=26 /DNA_END=2980 /DNA_ORIENTATION=+